LERCDESFGISIRDICQQEEAGTTNNFRNANAKRATPCVGICSTTYGDLVCRGCKRFAHEIVEWNSFAPSQQAVIWARLQELRDGAVDQCLRVCDPHALQAHAERTEVAGWEVLGTRALAYEVLRRSSLPLTRLPELGLEAIAAVSPDGWTVDLLRQIDGEFYLRSLAHYEHNFKIAAQ